MAEQLTNDDQITIGISSCLLGERVRYDGGHKFHSYIVETLGSYFDFVPFCPETSIGLGVPRETIRLEQRQGVIRCVGTKSPELDVTDALDKSAENYLSRLQPLHGYILKKDSPSCGMERVKLYHNGAPRREGVGRFAAVLMQMMPQLPVEEEGRLGDPVLRENFIQRVFIYKRWKSLLAEGVTRQALTDFHGKHKLTLFSHSQDRARELGKWLADSASQPLEQCVDLYFARLMQILKIRATRKNHVNVLQHIQGYLKKQLDKDDKAELTELINSYRLGEVPLIVPIVLLRHHFRKFPDPYIEQSVYMSPHPKELMLLNAL